MRLDEQMPRHCFYWLLIANILLLLPHIERLPPWLLLVYLVCAAWRWKIFHNSWPFPNAWIKAFLVVVAIIGIRSHYKNMFGIEPTIAILLTGSSLKLIEMKSRRDVYVLIFLGYFIALTAFLFNRDWFFVIIMLVPLVFLTAALLALHQPGDGGMRWKTLQQSALLWLQSLPVMLVLFLVIPRMSPFWQVPVPSQSAKTGISDSMSPGEFGRLSRDASLAFRVQFNGDMPAREELYFRTIVMENFDGKTWRPALDAAMEFSSENNRPSKQNHQVQRRYRIIVEPTQQRWLFALDMPQVNDETIRTTSRRTVIARNEIYRPFSYWVDQIDIANTGSPDQRMLAGLLNLPANTGEMARQLAMDIRSKSSSAEDFAHRVLQYFGDQEFFYTLKPPVLTDNVIDGFLFETRRGFCEHYASAFVYLMRAGGVPARVVTGYQGGEINPLNNILMVRQYDAHAWAEIWTEKSGWQRFDPTAAVAPARILDGLEQALPDEFVQENFLFSNNVRQFSWLNDVRLRMAALDYYWTRWVLDYRGEQQLSVLQKLLGQVNWQRMLLFMSLILLPLGGLIFWTLLRGARDSSLTPLQKLYNRFENTMSHYGYPRQINEAPLDYAERLSAHFPAQASAILAFSKLFSQQMYADFAENNVFKMKRILTILQHDLSDKNKFIQK